MTMRYLLLVVGVTAVWVVALLLVAPFAQFIEQLLLLFLSRTAG